MLLIFRHDGENNYHSLWLVGNNNPTNAYITAHNMFNWNKDANVAAISLGNYKIKFYLSTLFNYSGDIIIFFLN